MAQGDLSLQQRTGTGKEMRKRILTLAWPVIAEMSLQTVTQIVDMIMVGRLGPAAITAIGLSIYPMFFAQSIFSAIGVGTTALVARFVGKDDFKLAGRVLEQSIIQAVIATLIFVAALYTWARQIVTLMGAEAAVIPLGETYIRYTVPGFVFMLLGMIVTAALRGAGDTRTPMKVNILVNIINVIGNYCLIFGKFGFPALGVKGAAIATSFSRGVGGIILFLFIFSTRSILRTDWRGCFSLDLELSKRILKVGYPATLEQLVMRTAQLLYVRLVSALGTLAFAAHQIAINVESISYMPGWGFAVAATTMVGQYLGAGREDLAEESGYESWKLGVGIMGLMAMVFFFFPQYLVRLYTDEPQIIQMAAGNLRIVAFAQIPMATQFIFAGALRGAGDTKPVFYSTMLGNWLGRLAGAYVLINYLGLGLTGAWLAMCFDWVIRGTYVWFRYRGGSWKKIQI